MSDEHVRWEELAAGHALDALEPAEEQEFTEHVRGCLRCRRDVAALVEVTGELAYAADAAVPPEELADRIMAAAMADRREPLRVVPSGADGAAPARRRFAAAPFAAAAAVVLVLALVAGNLALRTQSHSRLAAVARRDAALACLTAPDAARYPMAAGGGPLATGCVRGGRAYLVVGALAPNAPDSVYVLWWQDAAAALHPVERFDVTAHRPAVYELPLAAPVADVGALAISLEPGRALPVQPTRKIASGARST